MKKPRSDIKVGNLEKKLGLQKGSIRNPKTGRKRRKDATLKGIEKYNKSK
jgi:hypothetical protein